MVHYFIVPGLGNSGPEHWQTYFEAVGAATIGGTFSRIQQEEWDAPHCEHWIANIDRAIANIEPTKVVLIAHSLGCTAVARWAGRYGKRIKGALLVAPSDIEAPPYTFPSEGFEPIPLEKLPFPSIVVASTDDQWVSLERAQLFATHWGSQFVNIGSAGHINTASGHGPWPAGLDILRSLA